MGGGARSGCAEERSDEVSARVARGGQTTFLFITTICRTTFPPSPGVLEGEFGLGWGVGGVYAVEEAAD